MPLPGLDDDNGSGVEATAKHSKEREEEEQTTHTVNQSSGFNIYEGEILIKCHHKWWYMDCNSGDNGMQTERTRGVRRKS